MPGKLAGPLIKQVLPKRASCRTERLQTESNRGLASRPRHKGSEINQNKRQPEEWLHISQHTWAGGFRTVLQLLGTASSLQTCLGRTGAWFCNWKTQIKYKSLEMLLPQLYRGIFHSPDLVCFLSYTSCKDTMKKLTAEQPSSFTDNMCTCQKVLKH